MAHISARARIRWIIVLFGLLSLIPFLMGAVLFSRTFAALERGIIEKNAAVLEQSGRLIDQQLRQFDQIVQQIAAMSEIDELLSVIDPFETHNMSRLIEILESNRFFPYDMTNDLVLAYFLVLRESELVIAPNILYPLDSFYQYLVSYPPMSLDSFRKELVDPHYAKEFLPVRETRINGKRRRVITFVHSFGVPTNHDFNMLILIDEQSIARLLKGVESGNDGFVAIVDATGHVITVFGNDDPHVLSKALELDPLAPVSYIEFDGKQQLVSRVHAPYAGWDFIASRPVQSIRQEIRFFRTTMFGSIILFAGLAAALAMFLAFRTGKPLLHVVRIVAKRNKADDDGSNLFQHVERSVIDLIDQNEHLQREIEHQTDRAIVALVGKLISASVHDERDIGPLVAGYPTIATADHLLCAIVTTSKESADGAPAGSRESLIRRLLVKSEIAVAFGETCIACDYDEDELVLIVWSNQERESEFNERIHRSVEQLTDSVRQSAGLSVLISVGRTQHALSHVARSFDEARSALRAIGSSEAGDPLYCDELPARRSSYYFPGDLRNRVEAFTRAGRPLELASSLDELYNNNFAEGRFSADSLRLLLFELVGLLVRIEEDWPSSEAFKQSDVHDITRTILSEQPIDAFARIRSRLAESAEAARRNKQSHNEKLAGSIRRFVDENTGNRQLGLKLVAQEFELSEGYVSQFFHEQIGVSFHKYVEQMRMQRALRQLEETDHAIATIAAESGYASVNAFCRAFKRIRGVSASDYRGTARVP